MANDTKTAADAMKALVKAMGDKLDSLKKTEKTHTPADVAETIRKAAIAKIDSLKSQFAQMQKAEDEGNSKLQKNIGGLPSDTPSAAQIADGNANKAVTPAPRSVFSIMGKTEIKEVKAKGSGGQVKKVKLAKDAMNPAKKPAGIPAAGKAPEAPKAPQAAGAAPAQKMELPQTPEKANGGQVAKKMELPQTPEKANGGQATEKMELPQTSEKANGGQKTNKMELPQTPEKANGGQMKKDEMMEKAIHPSPVFNVKPHLGGKDQMSMDMTDHALASASSPAGAAAQGKAPKLPTVEQHADRASMYADFMPKVGKAEMDSVKCSKCKQGMTLCKCK